MKFFDFFRGSRGRRIAAQYMAVLREMGEHRRLTYDAKEQLVVAHDEHGHPASIRSLNHLSREILAASSGDHEAIYRRYALGTLEVAGDQASSYELVKGRLRILLKDVGYPDYIALSNRCDFPESNPSELVFEHLVGDVVACCIEERAAGLRFVTHGDLSEWQVDAATALADAKANIRALPFVISDPMPARYVFHDDSFQAARFVNPQMFEGIPVRGEWVAVIPDRDTFFVADSEDLETVAGLAGLALRQLEAGERTITGSAFVLRAGSWQVYEPPQALRALFTNVALQYRANDWKGFKAVLEKDLARNGEDIFVAPLQVYEQPDDDTNFSVAVWSRGVETILPQADRVLFYDDRSETARIAHWNDVVGVIGAEMHQQPGLPNRYRVTSFPSAEQLVAMGAKSL